MKALAILAFAAAATVAFAAGPAIVDISQPDLDAAVRAKSATILDVNGTESYAAGHIPGAIDFVAHRGDIAKLLPADKTALIVAYCGDVHCTAYRQAYYKALDLGYTNVRHFAPGIRGWEASGEPTQKGGG
ncbi:MAG TPA: rhodanese-like domain-containing protein [Opitutaceae bacterium]|jgi:rhodanese-related sulfurtransferase